MATITARVRNTGLVFGGLVAGIAATMSYLHMQKLAQRHAIAGLEWTSWFTPLSVDGLMVVSSIALVQALRTGAKSWREVPPIPVIGLVLGLGVSLAANYGADETGDVISRLVSVWPAVAFAVVFELLVGLSREEVKPKVKKAKKIKTPSSADAAPTAPVEEVAAGDAPAAARTGSVNPEAEPVRALHVVPPEKPEWLTDDMTARDAMFAYLDRNPDATGADLDRFGMAHLGTRKDYGRGVRRAWLAEQQKASGE